MVTIIQTKPFYECVIYIRGKESSSKKFQKSLYTFIFKNNSAEYNLSIKKGNIKICVYYLCYIYYHHNGSPQKDMTKLMNKTLFTGDNLIFESPKLYLNDKLYIEHYYNNN